MQGSFYKKFFREKKKTIEDLAGDNSLQISINSSEESSKASRVIATYREMLNEDGWLPLSLTNHSTVTSSFTARQ